MDRSSLLRLAPRLLLAWGLLTLLVNRCGAQALLAAAPLVEGTVEWLMPGFVTTMAPNPHGGGGDVLMVFQAVRPIAISGDHAVVPWIKVQEGINAGHDLVPAVILFAVLAAWPYRRATELLRALAWGTVVGTIVLAWTVSVHFAGLFEMNLQRVAAHYHQVRHEPFVLTQMLFFESGGLWLVALLAAASIALIASRRAPR